MLLRFFLALLFSAFLSSNTTAQTAGHWRITGTLVNVDSELGNILRCEKANVNVRVRSRWANGAGVGEHPWGPSWGQFTTGAQGQFSKTGPRFANQGKKRDLLIEFQKMGQWQTLKLIEDYDGLVPHTSNGNVWTFDLGALETTAFDCAFEGQEAKKKPEIKINPDAFKHSGVDLEIVDSEIRRRTINNMEHPPGRVEWEVTIRNNGNTDYLGTGQDLTKVQLRLYRPSSQPTYDILMSEPIPAGETRTFFSPSSGNFGNTASLQPRYRVLFTVDPDDQISESDESNNTQPGCYAPLTEEYFEGWCDEQSSESPQGRKTSPLGKSHSVLQHRNSL